MKIRNTLIEQSICPPTAKQLANYLAFYKKDLLSELGQDDCVIIDHVSSPPPHSPLLPTTSRAVAAAIPTRIHPMAPTIRRNQDVAATTTKLVAPTSNRYNGQENSHLNIQPSPRPISSSSSVGDHRLKQESSPLVSSSMTKTTTNLYPQYGTPNSVSNVVAVVKSNETALRPNPTTESQNVGDNKRKKVQIDWNFEKNFPTIKECESYVNIRTYRSQRTEVTKSGEKTYFKCGLDHACPVRIYIHHVTLSNSYSIFNNAEEHFHPSGGGVGAGVRGLTDDDVFRETQKRGLPPHLKEEINQLLRIGISTPTRITKSLKEKYETTPTLKQIANYLDAMRRKFNMTRPRTLTTNRMTSATMVSTSMNAAAATESNEDDMLNNLSSQDDEGAPCGFRMILKK
jgi:hypothetical protein